ncbi:hypothetical protein AZE42_12889 [Rhizopogon vesiculosus]|uniref:Uncharacterized protein n=1 Tax=Rhizopogon vesiculosus TaxID=180088 RepID=A0A1J8PIW1_9AGAM|nr:hypothetical protein AZE42_12889 [Rhizopogon vesiculosus]
MSQYGNVSSDSSRYSEWALRGLPSFSFILGLAVISAITDPAISAWKPHEKRSHIPAGRTRARKHHPSAMIHSLANCPYPVGAESLVS